LVRYRYETISCDNFLQFFREIMGNESEWFSGSLHFDHAILQRWKENCWQVSLCDAFADANTYDCLSDLSRNVVWRDIDLSKGRKGSRMCSHRRKRHIMKPYERKCRLHSRDVTSEKFAESSRKDAGWMYGVSWIYPHDGP